jgi:hypothetical protein
VNLKRVYLVEFKLWRKTRSRMRRRELWKQSQMDLPGLPDYGPHGRPEIEARLISALDDGPEPAAVPSRARPKLALALPFLFIPLLPLSPRAWVCGSVAILIACAAGAAHERFRRPA